MCALVCRKPYREARESMCCRIHAWGGLKGRDAAISSVAEEAKHIYASAIGGLEALRSVQPTNCQHLDANAVAACSCRTMVTPYGQCVYVLLEYVKLELSF